MQELINLDDEDRAFLIIEDYEQGAIVHAQTGGFYAHDTSTTGIPIPLSHELTRALVAIGDDFDAIAPCSEQINPLLDQYLPGWEVDGSFQESSWIQIRCRDADQARASLSHPGLDNIDLCDRTVILMYPNDEQLYEAHVSPPAD